MVLTKYISDICFIVIVFILTRQVPFSSLSPLMNVGVLLLCITGVYRGKVSLDSWKLVFVLLILPLTASLCYSVFITDNQIGNALRFYFILIFVGLSYFISVSLRSVKIFVCLCILQVIVMIGIHIWLSLSFTGNSYLPVRFFFLEAGWGDVYTYNGVFYRIQIKGSALLVLATIVTNELKLFNKNNLVLAILILGVIVAGNFAYLIALVFYFLYRSINLKYYRTSNGYLAFVSVFLFFIVLVSPIVFKYVESVLSMKNTSLGSRGDQFEVLLSNLNENNFTFFFGQGLGNTVDIITTFRSYIGDVYYELQSVYIFNQLGVFFSVVYLIYHVAIASKVWYSVLAYVIPVYIAYVVYAVTNPYIFDTNHFVAIIVMNTMAKELEARNSPIINKPFLIQKI